MDRGVAGWDRWVRVWQGGTCGQGSDRWVGVWQGGTGG